MTEPQPNTQPEMTDDEAIARITAAMKDSTPSSDEKTNVHTFLRDVVFAEDNTKIGNLRDDKEINELGIPNYTVRGSKDMELISRDIMNNDYFGNYFAKESQITLETSLSRNGFLIRQASVQTKQVVDATKRVKRNKGMFGSEKVEEQGGDITQQS
jgi:hypothetical protein